MLSLRSLLAGRPALALLEIDSASLRVERLAARRLRVAGVDVDLDAASGTGVLDRLFAQRRIVLRHAQVDWSDRIVGETATLRDIDIALGSVGRRHRASLRAPELLDLGRGIDVAIEFQRAPFAAVGDWRQWRGEAYVGAERVEPRRSRAMARMGRRRLRRDDRAPGRRVRLVRLRARSAARRWSSWTPTASTRVDDRPVPLRVLVAEARAHRQLTAARWSHFPC